MNIFRSKVIGPGFSKALVTIALYALWMIICRYLILSVITYFMVSPAPESVGIRFQDINDAFMANSLSMLGFVAIVFVALLSRINPLSAPPRSEIISKEKLKNHFVPGLLQGLVLASAILIAFLLSGHYRLLGVYINFTEAPLVIGTIALRIFSLSALVYCEEYLFRKKLLDTLNIPGQSTLLLRWSAVLLVTFGYTLVKALQFDLGLMHLVSLTLLSLALTLRALNNESFVKGAGLWATMLVVFQALFSLPIFGTEFAGAALIKYMAPADTWDLDRFITGGIAGPLSGLVLQTILVLDVNRSYWRSTLRK